VQPSGLKGAIVFSQVEFQQCKFFATLKLLLSNQIKKKNNARFFEPEVQLSELELWPSEHLPVFFKNNVVENCSDRSIKSKP